MSNQKISKNLLSTEYIEFKKTVEKQRKVIARKQKLVDAQRDILKGMLVNCPHEEIESKESYYSGSYYDKASTDRWNECKLCGSRSEKKTEMHSYYG
jgi:hypothetical protein